ncbi:hypothetical protein BFJ69_g18518 [Fusarium oxysporum]|jgi:hypothetical protein|uniref:Uncharacterized protein n=1 Tax=Fusarium oxysporum TaxID=5507 RepID=A0A420M568_FUSOX|nr:hypothetical protein BFJ69_g18518 [Fusarium oxysporum]
MGRQHHFLGFFPLLRTGPVISNRPKGHTFDQAGRKFFQLFRQVVQTGSPEARTSSQMLVSSMSPRKQVLQHNSPDVVPEEQEELQSLDQGVESIWKGGLLPILVLFLAAQAQNKVPGCYIGANDTPEAVHEAPLTKHVGACPDALRNVERKCS